MTSAELPDITCPADIDRLVEDFYRRLLVDPIVGFLFTDIARIDLQRHLPVVSAFWQQQLLGKPGYKGQTFAVHQHLHSRCALTANHFHRWLYLFRQTLDSLFLGPVAAAANRRAQRIAASMQQALAQRGQTMADIAPQRGVQEFQPNNPYSTWREAP
jgi:hemoglobin